MAATNIYYVIKYLEFTPLTKVQREPTYEYIQEIKYEIKAGATTVNSDLIRGKYGHIVLVLNP